MRREIVVAALEKRLAVARVGLKVVRAEQEQKARQQAAARRQAPPAR